MKKEFSFLKFLIDLANIICVALFILLILKDKNIDILNVNKYKVEENQEQEEIAQYIVTSNQSVAKDTTSTISDNNVQFNKVDRSSQVSQEEYEQTEQQQEEIQNQIEDETTNSNSFLLYDQLDASSKYIYKAIENNFDNIIARQTKIELGTYLSPLVNEEDSSVLKDVYQSAITAFVYDYPETFVIDYTKMYLYSYTTNYSNNYNLYIDSDTAQNYYASSFKTKEDVENALEKVRSVRDTLVAAKTGNLYNDCKMVHDYLVDTIDYDGSAASSHTFDIYGALVDGRCVCDRYSKAYSYILNAMGYNVIRVVGTGYTSSGSENHAWNIVELDSKYYGIDTTWDDPIIQGSSRELTYEEKYKYFWTNDSNFKNTHVANGQFTEGGRIFQFPQL